MKEEFSTIEIGTWERLKEGKDVAILAVGSMVYPAVEASLQLLNEGIEVEVVNARFVKPLDPKMLVRILQEFNRIITVEENTLVGGFGSAILEFAEANNLNTTGIRRMGIPDKFIQHGSRNHLLSLVGLNKEGIIQQVKNIFTSDTFSRRVKINKTGT
jgi:1-deoxy-D-xylulose-5-phosphate synthase